MTYPPDVLEAMRQLCELLKAGKITVQEIRDYLASKH